MNATDRKRLTERYVDTYGPEVRESIEWRKLPGVIERNGSPESVWALVEDLGLRERYPAIEVLMWLGF